MYLTSSIMLRNACSFSNDDGFFRSYGELSYRPFGFHISIDTPPIQRPYYEITHFKKYSYNQMAKVTLPLRYLMPSGHLPGFYK